MKLFANIITFTLTLSAFGGSAAFGAPVSYDADCLERMLRAVPGVPDSGELSELGDTTLLLDFKKRKVRVDMAAGRVTHVGYRMFSDSQRGLMPYRPVFDFLERYALDADLPGKRVKSVEKMLAEDHVTCSKSGFRQLYPVATDTTLAVTVTNLNGNRYRIEWIKDDRPLYHIEFPIDYDLLHGTSMIENERRLVDNLTSFVDTAPPEAVVPSRKRLVPIYHKNYYILPGESYLLDNLTSNRYFRKEEHADSLFVPIYSGHYPLESLATLLVTGAIPNDFTFDMKVDCYNPLPPITVAVNNALGYFRSHGCSPFFGVGDFADGTATCYLVLRNAAEGYCHLMRITADVSQLDERQGRIKCRLTPYIPMSRVAALFGEPPTPDK
ncbi:hypothetical protein [uncultured Muribaculum sp.]|uniref:hypothetical protein n=1 Tax=uncultured Muribaculum sp. TaxID=1918613 RepID=UPI0025D3EF92|nr:hypothetical protein [uncultured Muribaculum sp.]